MIDKWEKVTGRLRKKTYAERRNGRGRREETFQDETALLPSSLSPLAGLIEPSSVGLIRYSQSPFSDAHHPSALCHGWNERQRRSFVDHNPCHILWWHRLPLQLGGCWDKLGGGKKGGRGFDPCFCTLMHVYFWQGGVSCIHTWVSVMWGCGETTLTKILRFCCEQTTARTERAAERPDSGSSLFFFFKDECCFYLYFTCLSVATPAVSSTHPLYPHHKHAPLPTFIFLFYALVIVEEIAAPAHHFCF